MSEPKTPLELYQEAAMERAMADPHMRVLLYSIVADMLYTFDPGYNHNATAYSLLAKKQAGLQLLSWMKAVSPQGVFMAESEYNNLIETEQGGGGEDGRG